MGTSWTLHIETDSGADTIEATGIEATTPTVTDGSSITTDVYFLAEDGIGGYRDRYKELREFGDVNGSEALRFGTSDTSTPWFRERYPETMPVESLLIGVEPGTDTIDQRGWWGLLTGLTDGSNPVSDVRVLEVEWFVLGRYSDYTDHTDVRDTLGDEIT